MAKVAPGIKIAKKKPRAARRSNQWALIANMDWAKAQYYIHYEIDPKQWGNCVKSYIKKHHSKEVVSAINKLPDWKTSSGSHWALAAYMEENHPEKVIEGYKGKLTKHILDLAEEGAKIADEKKADEKSKKNLYVPSIQERIRDQAHSACDDIEEWLDGFVTNKKSFDPKGFDFAKHFANKKVTQAHARKIKGFYQGEYEEAMLIQKLPTPAQIKKIKDPEEQDQELQLREAYEHLETKHAKTYLTAFEQLMGACDLVIDASKATRKPRKKKAPSKEKLIAKLKYLTQDPKLQLTSVNPVDILDSSEVWVYNIKTRKLGKYVADTHATIQVKGTTLLHYNEKGSVQKTLRKPGETLKEFKKAGKVQLRKFMEDIKTTDIKLNGRLNNDTIILKCL